VKDNFPKWCFGVAPKENLLNINIQVIAWSRNLVTWTIYDVGTCEMQENQKGI
jgi:hypothetical protein